MLVIRSWDQELNQGSLGCIQGGEGNIELTGFPLVGRYLLSHQGDNPGPKIIADRYAEIGRRGIRISIIFGCDEWMMAI